MVDLRDQSHPPSDPRPVVARGGVVSRAAADRSARAQLAVGLAVGIVLVAGGLYLWRRPRGAADALAAESASALAAKAEDGGEAAGPPDAGIAPPLTLSEARVLACHDPGPRKTPADQCDHVAPIEKALANAVEQAGACVPESVGPGTIEYVADVSFLRHKVSVILPHAGRSVRDHKALVACAAAVRSAMVTVGLGGIDHQHARYKISVTATYKPAGRGS
jgi:hypothetical protein